MIEVALASISMAILTFSFGFFWGRRYQNMLQLKHDLEELRKFVERSNGK